MSTALTLDVPDEVIQGASLVAGATQRNMVDVLQEALSLAFGKLPTPVEPSGSVLQLTDAQVLALGDARLPRETAARLSELSQRRQAGAQDPGEAAELAALMQAYQSLWLRQSEALAEAVRRGLRSPLAP
ncbi:MAG: hypothetical protein AVDCRST_MAG77-374 [uncultured Chloroflexi bacterium]|uniref:Uncharacterized protein n=1 Tax=uncultured Chloroflexota bacterium TaxID=166587 RepID=A0A6J4HBG6_9CHLR|nr:MAG: hypothetical protein AVDCRST_MAG77-374 [uncultured Chloroflexota bacterium]